MRLTKDQYKAKVMEYSHYLVVFLILGLQISIYLLYYGSINRLIAVLWYGEKVLFTKRVLHEVFGDCINIIMKLDLPDPLFYSYPAVFFAIHYLRRAKYKVLPSRRISFALYFVIIEAELLLDILTTKIFPFRGDFLANLPLHLAWIMDDMLAFLLFVRVLEIWLIEVRNDPYVFVTKSVYVIRSLFYAWLVIALGWNIPWLFYNSVIYYVALYLCGSIHTPLVTFTKDAEGILFPLAIFIDGLFVGMIYSLYRLIISAHISSNETVKKILSRRLGVSIPILNSVIFMLSKEIVYLSEVLTKGGILDAISYYLSLSIIGRERIMMLFSYALTVFLFWTNGILYGQNIILKKYAILKHRSQN